MVSKFSWRRWLQSVFQVRPAATRRLRSGKRRPGSAPAAMVSLLEPRVMLSAVTVNTVADSTTADTQLSLREAVAILHDGDPTDGVAGLGNRMLTPEELGQITGTFGTNDTVRFDAALNGSPILLTMGEFATTVSMSIVGNGASNTIIDAQSTTHVFHINDGSLTIDSLTIQNGSSSFGGAIYAANGADSLTVRNSTLTSNHASSRGGAIYAEAGFVDVIDSSITGNSAVTSAGGIEVSSGGQTVTILRSTISNNTSDNQTGGVLSFGTSLVITDSTINGNTSQFVAGGVGLGAGTAWITNSTISGNSAVYGGGIQSNNGLTTHITNSTITLNTATTLGGGIYISGSDGTLTISNSIVAGNTNAAAPDIRHLGSLTALSSLIGTNVGTSLAEDQDGDGNGNFIGGSVGGLINPMLAPLADNGGPTQTHALLPGSLALNSGNNSLAVDGANSNAPLTTDQRGGPYTRIFGGTVDMGALEDQPHYDFGDLPDTYGTTLANNGAYHAAIGLTLGATRDTEDDGQPSADALGDGADEDGISASGPFIVGQTTFVTVNVQGGSGFLNVWADNNRDGDFDDPMEFIIANYAVSAGDNVIPFAIPPGFAPGPMSIRFRLTSASVASPSPYGFLPDGEVEDGIGIIYEADFGDAPDTYGTTLANNGASHLATGPTLGATRDGEADGQPTADASGDGADEDGVTAAGLLIAGQTTNITINVQGGPGFVNAWADLNRDGDFDPEEQFLINQAVNEGDNVIPFAIPTGFEPGDIAIRYRLTSASVASPSPTGLLPDGEVEDYVGTIYGIDFGDAPDSYGTTAANNGAQHVAIGPALGATRDSDADGQPSADASGDGADEDGVTFNLIRAGSGSSFVVNVTNAPSGAIVDAWVDFNHNGTFEADEKIADSASVSNGNNTLYFTPPAGAIAGATFARVRLSTAGGLGATGAADDGEVEDYRVAIFPAIPAAPSTVTSAQFTNNTPLAIPDAGVVTSTIVVSGAGSYLYDLNLLTYIRHSFAADLDITITSPSGTVVTLTTDNGSGNDDVFNGTMWDDQADFGGQVPYTVNNGLVTDRAYVNGQLAPWLVAEEALGAFIGENPNGTWTITISDDLGDDTGSLDSWTLDVNTLTAAPQTVATTFTNTTPLGIPTGPGVVTSQIVVSGINGSILDVNLQTFLTHTFAADLDITITSPSGRVVTLTTDNGAGNDNVFNGTIWDDSANPGGQVPYTTNNGVASDHLYVNLTPISALVPEEAMAAFLGEDPNGTWTITISDDLAGDGGSLNSWSLTFQTLAYDYGDAPAGYAVTLAEDGARHVATGITLGATRDVENDGTHSANASADGADEDGVTFPTNVFASQPNNLTVNVSGAGFLNAWVDLNHDGDFGDANEQFAVNRAVVAGNNTVVLTLPPGLASGDFVFRFRVTSASVASPSATGLLPDGEVEDYFQRIYTAPSANPVITGFGTGVGWVEGQPPTLISSLAGVTDTDSPNFNLGTVTVTLTNNAQPGDVLGIRNQGTGVGQISVTGNTISYKAAAATPLTAIGTFTGGTNGQPLVITFNSNAATLAAVSALLKNLTFSSTSDNPTNAPRTVRVQVADGDSGVSAPVTKTIAVTPLNDSSVITGLGGPVTYTEHDPFVLIGQTEDEEEEETIFATITDADSFDFNNGTLVIQILKNGTSTDQLGIASGTVTPGGIVTVTQIPNTTAFNVFVGETLVGKLTGGNNGSAMTVLFNANATPARASSVLQAVKFWNTSHTPSTLPRTLLITVTDGDGGKVQDQTKVVNVVAVNDAPVLGGVTSPITFNGTPLLPFPTATLTDLDSTAYNLGTLTIQSTNGATGDLIDIRNQGTLPGQVNIVNGNQIRVGFTVIGTFSGGANGAPLVILLNANSSIANVTALMRNIRFTTSNVGSLPRTLSMTLQEADGTLSNPVSQTINGNVPT